MKLEPYKSYIIPDDGFDIYMLAIAEDWVAIKYGKDDSVSIKNTWQYRSSLLKRDFKKLDFSNPGFDGIGRFIIEILFDGWLYDQADMMGRK